MASSDATAVSNAHPVRVGQTWKYMRGISSGETRTIVYDDDGCLTCRDSVGETRYTSAAHLLANATLLDAPPAVSPPDAPPAGYAPCKKKRGRWTGEAKVKICIDCERSHATLAWRVLSKSTRLMMCDGCYLTKESFLNGGDTTNILRDSSRPELLPRARLSHDPYEWDLIDEARR